MKKIPCSLVLCGVLTYGLATAQKLQAQIIPDATLPQSSIVNQETITGGTASGATLFHSFQTFSIPTGGVAQFLPNAGIQNIVTRVTGTERSQINGLLSIQGQANLFFLNPNGITFGQDARLDINGSFIASTADSWTFSNGSEFSARTPQAPPLLRMSTPIGLQFGTRPGSIINQARLTLPPLRTLGFAGGDIQFDQGSYTSLGGNIFLMSAIAPGTVRIAPDLSLGESSLMSLGKIELSGTSAVNVGGLRGGAVQIRGGDVIVRDQARIFSDTVGAIDGRDIEIQAHQFRLQDRAVVRAFTVGTGTGGDITVQAKDTITLTGAGYEAFDRNYLKVPFDRTVQPNNLESAILAGTFGQGNAGNLTLEARQVRLENGAVLGNPTQGAGAGGDLTMRVAESIDVTSSGIGTTAIDRGKAGDLSIQTGSLRLNRTGVITAITLGDGDSGRITIHATDDVIVNGGVRDGFLPSYIATTTISDKGNAGNLEINARRIQIENGGTISTSSGSAVVDRIFVSSGTSGNLTLNASEEIRLDGIGLNRDSASLIATNTFGSANAGNIHLNTRRFVSLGQSFVVASTFASGQGGTITVNALDSINIVGQPSDSFGIGTYSGKSSFLTISQLPTATGAAGDVRLSTSQLSIQNNGRINVDSIGSGNAGTIQVNANVIRLENAGITATTNSGGKGNIDLRSQLILLRNGSQITTRADNSDGGNIDIKTGVLAAIPKENSDITANAKRQGGAINITSQGIFGFQQSRLLTSKSEITASSEIKGLDGTVTLTTFGTEPNVTAELPVTVMENSARIAQTCARFAKTSQFVMTERGGLEPSISEVVQSTPIWRDERDGKAIEHGSEQSAIVEATQWIRQSDGTIALVAAAPYPQTTIDCSAGESK